MITNYQKNKTCVQLKKIYSELSQAVQMAQAEYGSPEGWDYSLSNTEFFDRYFTPFIQVSRESVSEAKAQNIKYYRLNGQIESNYTNMYDNALITTLASGAQIFSSTQLKPNDILTRRSIIVDLNGFNPPNKLGRDLFSFIFGSFGLKANSFDDEDSNDVVRTRDDLINGNSRYNYQCNKSSRGQWCAAVIMADGWEIKDDYPW